MRYSKPHTPKAHMFRETCQITIGCNLLRPSWSDAQTNRQLADPFISQLEALRWPLECGCPNVSSEYVLATPINPYGSSTSRTCPPIRREIEEPSKIGVQTRHCSPLYSNLKGIVLTPSSLQNKSSL
ncbi:hypothetical protein XU18_2124 [Perkinsela sp. CCAP 1560/4]|nr:hypothetical protein XU18_2124 [Perkinsela sp. CCAP 1560/4]|eukprot:KNH07188.1 hypothetical protein XU18_2124 [Perkinsela sp. CCAP 1560/4]